MSSNFSIPGVIALACVAPLSSAPAQRPQAPLKQTPELIASTQLDTPPIAGPWRDKSLSPERRAELLVAAMTREEKLLLLRGFQGGFIGRSADPMIGPMQRVTDGYVPGIPRLGIPGLHSAGATTGVPNGFNAMGPRKGDQATALPSMMALSATFEPELAFADGKAVAEEFRPRGFNMVLGPGLNLTRDPHGGRNFEYLGGEDPLLAGIMAGNATKGVQSAHVMANLKHFVLHGQTKDSSYTNALIGEAALRESDLLAFEIANEIGQPASVMCAYQFINGIRSCQHDLINNVVLKQQWGFKGFILSDWGAVHDTQAALLSGGLDQESASIFDTNPYFASETLAAGIRSGQLPMSRIDDAVKRILWGYIASGAYDDPAQPGDLGAIDRAGHLALARRIAERAIVLLKNEGDILPLATKDISIALIGGRADIGVLTGGGSSAVLPYGGALKPDGTYPFEPPAPKTMPDGRPFLPARDFSGVGLKGLYIPTEPLAALRAVAGTGNVRFDTGVDLQSAAATAKAATVAIVVVNQINSEGSDGISIVLPGEQDMLVEAVAAANPNTIVLIQSGNPVAMPWLGKVKAALEIWYPGQDGAAAIANILFGKVNPSGRLPMTFPTSDSQSPRPTWPKPSRHIPQEGEPKPEPYPLMTSDGSALLPPAEDKPAMDIDYRIEGSNVGYRWFAKTGKMPLFPFGYGLSYTRFRYSGLSLKGGASLSATFTVTNVGAVGGAETAQLYVSLPGHPELVRLGGWRKVDLKPGASQRVTIDVDPRLLASYDTSLVRWRIDPGSYGVRISASATDPKLTGSVAIAGRTIAP